MKGRERQRCLMCGADVFEKDVLGINRKLLGEQTTEFYCMECFAEYLGCTVRDLEDKIEDFKEAGCILFA